MKLRNTINGGVIRVSDELAQKMIRSGSWESAEPKPKPAPAKKAAPRKPETEED